MTIAEAREELFEIEFGYGMSPPVADLHSLMNAVYALTKGIILISGTTLFGEKIINSLPTFTLCAE